MTMLYKKCEHSAVLRQGRHCWTADHDVVAGA